MKLAAHSQHVGLIFIVPGTVVELTLARIVDKKRSTITASLVREMKATEDPLFQVHGDSCMYSSGVNTKLLFLECLQKSQEPVKKDSSAIESNCIPSVLTDSTATTEQLQTRNAVNENEAFKDGSRQVFFKGRWYSEEDVTHLEGMARDLDSQIERIEVCKTKDEFGPQAENSASKAEIDETRIICAIFVVQGGALLMRSKGLASSVWKEVHVKISTGGLLTWGNKFVKSGQVMWTRAKSEIYDPAMTKSQFDFMNRKFEVMLEAGGCQKPVSAFSIDGGTVKAVPCKEAMEFVALTEEERNRWVLGINYVLMMNQESAQQRLRQRKQAQVCSNPLRMLVYFFRQYFSGLQEVGASGYRSVFITEPLARDVDRVRAEARVETHSPLGQPAPAPRLDRLERCPVPAATREEALREAPPPRATTLSSDQPALELAGPSEARQDCAIKAAGKRLSAGVSAPQRLSAAVASGDGVCVWTGRIEIAAAGLGGDM